MTGPGPVGDAGGGWTTETLLAHVTAVMDQIERRVTTRIDANDKRYEQRFLDAQLAVNTAMAAAEKAVASALSAAKEAVVKAETASDKRFEGVNEFRATLADQQRMLMPRTEAELRFTSLENLLQAATARLAEMQAQGAGAKNEMSERRARATDQRLVAAFIISLIVAAVAVVGLVLKLQGGTP